LHKLIAIGTLTIGAMAVQAQVKVVADEAQKRVDVTIDGKPFTAYVWPDSLMKPVLDPLVAPDGTTVTRGYPLYPGKGERVDHPHHAGLWFNYGNLDNVDYWNNSTAIPEQDRAKYGTIHHNKIVLTKSGTNSGELVVDSTWTNGQGKNVINQRTRYVFSRTKEGRSIDVLLTLHALGKLIFHDDKEGISASVWHLSLSRPTKKVASSPTPAARRPRSMAPRLRERMVSISPAKVLRVKRFGPPEVNGAHSPAKPPTAKPKPSPSSTTQPTLTIPPTGTHGATVSSPLIRWASISSTPRLRN
jgi:hypothetical protein